MGNHTITVLSAREFVNLMKMNNITDENVETFKNCVMISINDADFTTQSYFKSDHSNVIRFFFYDVTETTSTYNAMNENDAHKMFEFIKTASENPKITNFIIHCQAGISRSGAVGEFIQEFLEIDHESFIRRNPCVQPNSLIKSLLNNEKRKYESSKK